MIGQGLSLAFFLLFPGPAVRAVDTGDNAGIETLPALIARLDSRDALFKQYQDDVETARRRLFTQERTGEGVKTIAESLTIYRYTPYKGEDIFTIAARCNIPYAALAGLNRISHPLVLEEAGTILIPSVPGIFIPQEPESDLERLMSSGRLAQKEEEAVSVTLSRGDKKELYWFFPDINAKFNSTEEGFFRKSGFRYPLRSYRLTSSYGPRINPVTGRFRVHEGLDLAAPMGTDVFAAGDGVVTETGSDAVYGNYIIIKHADNWASLYGHLSRIETALQREVRSGTLIGKVGSTGQSTGPHLHFELRRNGKAQDPGKYLFQ